MFEFLLINHPLDCPVCDKGGECPLQDFSYTFGPDQSRMDFPRRMFDGEGVKADVDFGPTLMLNRNRCILCTRCVRFMRDVDGDAQIDIIDRGNGSEIATFQEEGVHSLLSGNLMDVCPVGAITTRDYRFKSRPWDNPHAVDTICTLCSKGCNTTAWIKAKPEWAKGSRLIRFTPRFNPDVNGYWMCDIGRFDYHWIEGDDRLRQPLVRTPAASQQPVSWHDADREAARPPRRGRRREPRRRAVPALGARVARRAVPVPPPHRRADRRAAPQVDQRQLALPRRSRSPRGTKFKVPAVDAPNVNGARILGLAPGAVGDGRATRTSRRCARPSRPATSPALYVFDPGPDGSLGDTSWIVDARDAAARCRCSSCRACCMTDLARAADFVLPGRIVRREGGVLHERPGTRCRARRARSPPPGDAHGRLADPRRPRRRRSACRSTTRAPREVRARHRRAASPASRSSTGIAALAFGRPDAGADTGCRRRIRRSAGSGTSCSRICRR